METSGSRWVRRRRSTPGVLILIIAAAILPRTVQGDELPRNRDDDRLQPIIEALRSAGHRLFANAVQMADIHELIVSGNYFTLFAPPDGALYQLDLSVSAAEEYAEAVRRHIAIPKFSYGDLERLQAESRLRTIANNKTIAVSASHGERVTVDGVLVCIPDVYSDHHIAVHGVDGVLNGTASRPPIPPPAGFWPPLVPSESNDLNPAFPGLYPEVNPLPTILPYPYPGREHSIFTYEVASTPWDQFPPSPPNDRGDSLGDGPPGVRVSPAPLEGRTRSESKTMGGGSRGDESQRRHPHV